MNKRAAPGFQLNLAQKMQHLTSIRDVRNEAKGEFSRFAKKIMDLMQTIRIARQTRYREHDAGNGALPPFK